MASLRVSEWRKLPVSLAELCIDTTLRCGQSFRWKKVRDNEWFAEDARFRQKKGLIITQVLRTSWSNIILETGPNSSPLSVYNTCAHIPSESTFFSDPLHYWVGKRRRGDRSSVETLSESFPELNHVVWAMVFGGLKLQEKSSEVHRRSNFEARCVGSSCRVYLQQQ